MCVGVRISLNGHRTESRYDISLFRQFHACVLSCISYYCGAKYHSFVASSRYPSTFEATRVGKEKCGLQCGIGVWSGAFY